MDTMLLDSPPSKDRVSALKAAYDAGYTDAVVLLHSCAIDRASEELIERTHARYQQYVVMEPGEEAHAYMVGFGDAAADNLPCPDHAFEDRKIAAYPRPIAARASANTKPAEGERVN